MEGQCEKLWGKVMVNHGSKGAASLMDE